MGTESSDTSHTRVLALLTRGAAASVVWRALEDEGLQVVQRDPGEHEAVWRDARSFDAVLVDDTGMDPDQARMAIEQGWIRTAVPFFVVVERLPGRARYMEWLEAGAWDVVKIPLEAAALGLRLRNILAHGRPGVRVQPNRPYSLETLEHVADETLALVRRYGRDLQCVAVAVTVSLESPREKSGSLTRQMSEAARALVRSSDLIGISDERTLLILLPDTDEAGAAIFVERLETTMEEKLRGWGVLAPLVTAFVRAQPDDTGRDLLERAVRGLNATPR